MFKNKVLIFLVALLIAITLILTAAFVLYTFLENVQGGGSGDQPVQQASGRQQPAAEIKSNTVFMQGVTTSLAGNEYIMLSLAFELENKKAKVEFETLDFKVKDVLIRTLADLTAAQVGGSKGYDHLTSLLNEKINTTILSGNKLKNIYITDLVLQ